MSGTHLTARAGRYHFRLRIPADLLHFFGRREIHRSLRASDKRQAVTMARTLRTTAECAFTSIRLRRMQGAVQEELVALARSFYADGLPVCRASIVQRQAHGENRSGNAPRTLREAANAYLTEREARWEPKTALMQRASLDLFLALIGDKPLSALTRQDCRNARDTLAQLPANMTKRFPGMTPSQVLALRPAPMKPKTVNRHLSALTGLLNWCVREGLLPDSPAKGLMVAFERRADLERDAFTTADLQCLFARLNPDMGAKYWLSLVALHSGMRLEEIAQLRNCDLRQVEGVWVFDVHGRNGNKLKTAAAERLVPVHPALIRAGLPDFAATAQLQDSPLWPGLSRGADGFLSSPFSKWFGRFRRAAGITSPRLTFHSFRHTFIDALKQAGVEELTIRELVGHANPSITTGRYGKRYAVGHLVKAVGCIAFPLNI